MSIDLGKNSCSIVGLDAGGAVVVRRRMNRDGVIAFAAKLEPCTMAMEACCGAHHTGPIAMPKRLQRWANLQFRAADCDLKNTRPVQKAPDATHCEW